MAALLGGCSSEAKLAAGPLGEEALLRASPAVTASQLMPLGPRVCAYRDQKGLSVEYRLDKIKQGLYVSQLVGRHMTQIRLRDDMAMVMPGEQDLLENVIIAYKPALLFMPEILKQGQTVSQESKMLIKYRNTGKVRDRGICRVEIKLLGQQTVQTNDGEVDAVVVQSVRYIKLKMAMVVVTLTEAYQPNYGLVAQRVEREIKLMGLPGPVLVQSLVLDRRQADKSDEQAP